MLRPLRDLAENLNENKQEGPFTLWYALRDPAEGSGNGTRGVRHPNIVRCYIGAFRRLRATLECAPFSWESLPQDVQVYICALDELSLNSLTEAPGDEPLVSDEPVRDPFTLPDGKVIGLPCRSQEADVQAAYHRAAIEAVHEGTHAYCFAARPLSGPDDTQESLKKRRDADWRWFLEATAVFMESYCFADNPEGFRFSMDWVDRPEIPLNFAEAEYQAGMFVRYLARRFTPKLIRDLWHRSKPAEDPFKALNRLLPKKFRADDDICPLFGDYSVDSYFIADPRSDGFSPEVFARFTGRALTHSWRLAAAASIDQPVMTLDHLASRHFRVIPAHGVQSLRISAEHRHKAIEVRAAVVTRGDDRGDCKAVPLAGWASLRWTGDIQHVIVCVSNTSIVHDNLEFSFRVEARPSRAGRTKPPVRRRNSRGKKRAKPNG